MKSRRVLLAGLLLTPLGLWARPVDLSPPSEQFGFANPEGYLEIWREVDELDFGGGLKFPLRFGFSSCDRPPSKYLGLSWTCPLLEAKAERVREDLIQVTLLCGKKLFLQQTGNNSNLYRSPDHQWSGEGGADQLRLSRSDGWELSFKEGRVERLKSDTGRVLVWEWEGDRIHAVLDPVSKKALEVQFEPQTGRANALVFEAKRYDLGFAPAYGQPGAPLSLSSVKWPDGRRETYPQSTPRHQVCELAVQDRDGKTLRYGFDSRSRFILTDGEWTYEIAKDGSDVNRPRISRRNHQGQETSYFFDTKNGIDEYKDVDGTLKKQHFIMTPGPNYMKVHRIEETVNGRTSPLYEGEFGSDGQSKQETYHVEDMAVTVRYEYDKNGKQIAAISEGKPLWRKEYDDAGRILKEEHADGRKFVYAYPPDGSYKITGTHGDATATALYDKSGNFVKILK